MNCTPWENVSKFKVFLLVWEMRILKDISDAITAPIDLNLLEEHHYLPSHDPH